MQTLLAGAFHSQYLLLVDQVYRALVNINLNIILNVKCLSWLLMRLPNC